MKRGKGRVKGNAIREFISWYEREQSQSGLALAIETLPREHRRHFDTTAHALGVFPSTWYPSESIHAALDALFADKTPKQVATLADAGGRATVRAMMRGLYRVIFTWVMTPGRFGKVVQTTWKLSYDTGRVEHRVLSDNRHQGIVVDWAGHHPFLCQMNVAAKAALYGEMGCRGVNVDQRYCVSDGDSKCGSIISWD